jgi:hypothetical protein
MPGKGLFTMLRPLQEPVMTSVSLTSLINLLKLALGINMVRARIR